MNRRDAVLALAAASAAPFAVRAQPATRPVRIGYLSMTSPERDRQWVAALREGLRELGYVEGEKYVLEQRHAPNDAALALEAAGDLLRRDVAVILVYAAPILPTLKTLVTGIPIVTLGHPDPVGSGIIASLARPGGNITGLTDGHAELAPKRLGLLKEAVPSASRFGVLFNPLTAHAARQVELLQAAARERGYKIMPIKVERPHDIERSFEAMRKQQVQALILAPDPSWAAGQERRIADLAIAQRIPSIGSIGEWAAQGLLLAYGTDFAQLWRKSATYVDKILKGRKPVELPVEFPTRFNLAVNLRTARVLGLTIPHSIMLQAENVIE